MIHVDGRIPPRSEVLPRENRGIATNNVTSYSNIPSISGSHMGAGNPDVTMVIVPVKVGLHGSFNVIETYAFLDPGSNVSFCFKKLQQQLGCHGKRLKITMDTMGVPHSMHTDEIKNIEVFDLHQHNTVKLPAIYTKDKIPVTRTHIPTMEDISQWPHLEDIDLPSIDGEIGLLLGNNIPDAYSPLEVSVGPEDSPHATRSRLGWIVWNVIRPSTEPSNLISNRADVIAIEGIEEHRSLQSCYRKSVALDFPERYTDEKREHSVEDKKFLRKMCDSKALTNGHYKMCLPFKNEKPNLPDNRYMVTQRLESLKRKLQSQPQFHADYTKFMENILAKGFAEGVPPNEIYRADGYGICLIMTYAITRSQKNYV